MTLTDSFGRSIRYMRVSITDRCNLRCTYCMPQEGVPLLRHDDMLRFEEIERIVKVATRLGVRSVRLTGGEPLLKRNLVDLVAMLASIPQLEDLALTTNGLRLQELAVPLRQAGLRRINVGLPALDQQTWARLTRPPRGADVRQTLAGVRAALDAGLTPVKLNAVVLRGLNDELEPFLELSRRLPLQIRFIEYMTIGPADSARHFVPASAIRAQLARAAEHADGAEKALRAEVVAADGSGFAGQLARRPAGMGPAGAAYRLPGAPGTLAVIAPMSEHVCASCNRLRLSADGRLRTCLFSDEEHDLRPALRPRPDDAGVRRVLLEAVAAKPRCMPAHPGPANRKMAQIGG